MSEPVNIRKLLGPLLRGKIDGRRHFGVLSSAISGFRKGSVARLDFAGVEDLSASWIASAVLPLLTWTSSCEIDLYPVLDGVYGNEKQWADEFEFVASRENYVLMASDPQVPAQCHLLGDLDPILRDTIRVVQEQREVTGAGLKRLVPDENIGATAWSNRLRDLHSLRLVRRVTRGREQLYSTPIEVILDGSANSGFSDRELSSANAT